MKTNLYPYLLSILISSITASAQNNMQKVYPGSPLTTGFTTKSFTHDKGMAMDEQTLIIADYKACIKSLDSCRKEGGAVTIYKRNLNSVWAIDQVLTSPAKEYLHFGASVALYGNMLAISSEAEYRPDNIKSGVVYLYKRANMNAEFELVTKVYGEDPFGGNLLSFATVDLNSTYLVAPLSPSNQIWVYRIAGDSLIFHHAYKELEESPTHLYLTDDNRIISHISNGYNKIMEIKEDTVIRTYYNYGGGYHYPVNSFADGNTIFFINHQTRPPSYHFEMNKTNTSYRSVQGYNFQNEYIRYTYKEDEWFIALLSSGEIKVFRFKGSAYQYAGSIPKPAGTTTSYGSVFSVTNGVLAVGDPADSTLAAALGSNYPGKGAACIFNLTGFNIITGLDQETRPEQFSIISPNPFEGDFLTINMKGTVTVDVMDTQGQLLKKAVVSSNSCNLQDLKAGVYMLKISSESESIMQRLLVQ